MYKKYDHRKFRLIFGIVFLIVLIMFTVLKLWASRNTSAAWFDGKWAFRQRIPVTAHTALETNVYLTPSTFDSSDNSKYQSDCGDLRFTDTNGNLLKYYIVSGCGTGTTTVHVLIPSFAAGASDFYMYYGNPTAINGFEASDFTTAASSVTLGSNGSEEIGPAPVAYWKFDEGQGQTVRDSSSNSYNATLGANSSSASDDPSWQSEDQCISGKCLKFDGTNDFVVSQTKIVGGPAQTSFGIWARPNSTSNSFIMEQISGHFTIQIVNNQWRVSIENVSASAVNVTGGTVIANKWAYVVGVYDGSTLSLYVDGKFITSSSQTGNVRDTNNGFALGCDANTSETCNSDFFNGYLDEMKVYSYALSSAQVRADFNLGAEKFGKQNQYNFLSNGLTGYWKMDESAANSCTGGSNDSCDSSGNGFDLAWQGDTTTSSTAKYDRSIALDGTGDYATVADNDKLDITDSITISAWVNASSLAAYHRVLAKMGSGESTGYMLDAVSGTSAVRLRINTTDCTTASSIITTGTWYHLVGTYDRQNMNVYVNGVLAKSCPLTEAITANTEVLAIGNRSDNNSPWNGYLDGVRLYNRALSGLEISSLYNWSPGPVAHYKFEEGTGTAITDSSSYGNNGTLTGAIQSTWVDGKFGKAANFVRSAGNNILITDSGTSRFDLYSGMSVSFWVKPNSMSSSVDQYVIAKASSYFIALRRSFQGNLDFRVFVDGSFRTYSPTITLSDNIWYYITATYDSSTRIMNVYVNGVSQGTTTLSGLSAYTITQNDQTFEIGSNGGTAGLDSVLDEVKIYNYARTPSQVVEDMNSDHPEGGSPVGSQTIYWKFDEQTGSTTNNSVNGSTNGSISNALWKTNTVCKTNGCLLFDGTGDVVTIPVASDTNVDFNNSEPFSASVWVYPTAIQGSSTEKAAIIAKYDASTPSRGYRLYLENDDTDSTGNFEVEIYDESTDQVITASSTVDGISVNNWYHVAFTFNGGTAGAANDLKLYVNGRHFSNNANSSFLGLEDVSADFTVGEYDSTDAAAADIGFTGYIDEVKVYSGLLTNQQINIDMNAGAALNFGVTGALESSLLTSGTGNSPLAMWNFEEGTGSTVNDISGNGYNGTNTSTNWASGKFGKGLVYNGTSSVTNVYSANFASAFPGNAGTLEGWIKVASSSIWTDATNRYFARFTVDTNNEISIRKSSTDNTILFLRQGSGTSKTQSQTITSTDWIHVALTWDTGADQQEAYVNGVPVGSTQTGLGSFVGSLASTGSVIGSQNTTPTGVFSGSIDHVTIYNYARTNSQVLYDYNRAGPRVFWKMNECQGSTLNDSSGNNFPGTITVGASNSQTTVGTCKTSGTLWGNGANGKYNASVNLDGDDTIACTDANCGGTGNTDLGISPAFTITAWIKTTMSGTGIIVGKKTNTAASTAGYQMFISSGFLGCRVADATNITSPTGTKIAINDGNWHFVACIADGSNLSPYSDSRLDTTNSTTSVTGTLDNNQDFKLGATGSGASFFTGQIDDVRLYRYALSQSQLNEVYNQGAGARFGPSAGTP